jgi:hypothetical protein
MMERAELRSRYVAWQKRSCAARKAAKEALAAGSVPEGLADEMEELRHEEEALLEAALPYARERLCATRDLQGRCEVLASDFGKIGEAPLPDEVRAFAAERLGEEQELPEPELPPGFEPEETDGGWTLAGTKLSGTPFTSVGDAASIFLFTDEGAVYLLEHNLSWQLAPKPVAEEVFACRLAKESASSCLAVDADGRLLRISYARLETAEALLKEPLFGGPHYG